MNTKHISLAISAVAVVALLTGCAKNPMEDLNSSEQLSDLELSYVGATETKAAIDGTTFPTEGEIGLFLFEDENATEPYGEGGYTNVKYSYNSTKGKWTASPSIKVGSTPGYLYGYYPYNGESTDIKAIPIVSSLNGDDVMYATSQTVTDKTASQTAITMNHALARVSITIKNNGYTGEAKLSKIKFGGVKTAENGTLNALDGKITATNSDVTLDVPTANQTITAAGTTCECLLVPSDTDDTKQTVKLTLTIDGQDKEAELAGDNGVIIAQGSKSNITITLSNKGISIQNISVNDWKVVEVGGHKVTIAVAEGVDSNDILTKAYVDGNNVIIRASSNAGQRLKCTPSGGILYPQNKTDNLVYTFLLSDIESDVTAIIGYANPVNIILSPSDNADWGTAGFVGDCYEGHKISFMATAKGSRCQFVEWQDPDGNTLSKNNPYEIILSSDLTLKPIFKAPFGSFSISNDDGKTTKQIHFSPGNLYNDGHGYFFENEQYEYHTYDSSGYIWGLFGWSTRDAYFNYGMSTSTSSRDYSGQFVDWGHAIDFSNTWCTLSIEEWLYLISGRLNAAQKVGYATVNNVHGIIFLPDSFTDPKKNKDSESFVPKSTTGWDANVYTTGGNWEAMEDAGAVFLPAAGQREGSDVLSEGILGGYWSSSESTIDYSQASAMIFLSDSVDEFWDFSRYYGYSVRLVKDAE